MTDIALALGGGGIKGLAHLGVIRGLEKAGFTIKAVAGTSAGSLVGCGLAAGYSVDRMEAEVSELDQRNLFGHSTGEGPGLLGLSGVIEIMKHYFQDEKITDLKIPFACTAVDLRLSREKIFTREPVVDAVLSSIAFPGIFPPHEYDGHFYIDGGVLDPVPVLPARMLAPDLPIFAVSLNPTPDRWADTPDIKIPGPAPLIDAFSRLKLAQAFQIFTRSMDISARMLTEVRLKSDLPDLIIRPDVMQYGLLDLVNPHLLIRIGEQTVESILPEIQRSVRWDRQFIHRISVNFSEHPFYYESRSS
jgi:NTE family protein